MKKQPGCIAPKVCAKKGECNYLSCKNHTDHKAYIKSQKK
jgi:hypothetical protein